MTRSSVDDRLTGRQVRLIASRKHIDRAVQPANFGLADLTLPATVKAKRGVGAMRGEDRAFHRLEEPDGPTRAVAGAPLPLPARTLADVKVFEQDRETQLEDFRVGQP